MSEYLVTVETEAGDLRTRIIATGEELAAFERRCVECGAYRSVRVAVVFRCTRQNGPLGGSKGVSATQTAETPNTPSAARSA